MRLVTVHLAEGQSLRQLEGDLRALAYPGQPVRMVSGRHGRSGVLVESGLALRYLAALETAEAIGLTVGSDVRVEVTARTADGAEAPFDPAQEQPPARPVAEPAAQPEAKPVKAAKAAPKAAKAAPKKPEGV